MENNYFELLSSHEEDIVFIDVIRRDIDSNRECIEALSKYSHLDKDKFLRSQMTGKILWGGVRKAVKTDIILSHQIKYSDQKIGEEALYSFDVLYHSQSIGFITSPVYRYEVRQDSLSHSLIDDPWGPVAIELRNRLQNMKLYNQFSDTINALLYSAAAVSLIRIAKNYSGREYKMKAKNRIEQLNAELDKSVQYDKDSLSFKVKILLPLIKTKSLFLIKCVGKLK